MTWFGLSIYHRINNNVKQQAMWLTNLTPSTSKEFAFLLEMEKIYNNSARLLKNTVLTTRALIWFNFIWDVRQCYIWELLCSESGWYTRFKYFYIIAYLLNLASLQITICLGNRPAYQFSDMCSRITKLVCSN